MNAEELLEVQNRVEEITIEIRTLWSMLEAVHDAMRAEFASPDTYQDAIYGMSRQAYRLKQEVELFLDWINKDR
ncbi:MAG: hypothetical protein HFE76_10655 [Firmicutes bacterium]|nr:hypothetical protein [Bacillota bacterium]